MLDNQIEIETPESISMQLVPAGPMPRILAYTIDLLIRIAIILILVWVMPSSSNFGYGFFLLVYFVIDWFYSVFCEMFNDGMTIGKYALRIQVIHDNGTPLRWGGSILRNILRAADFLPFGYMFGLITMCCNQSFKRLGDLAAGTIVVYKPQLKTKPQFDTKGSRPMPFPLTKDEQQAIVAFAEREQQLSPSRQQELANILGPIIPAQDNKAPNQQHSEQQNELQQTQLLQYFVLYLKQLANGIVGQGK